MNLRHAVSPQPQAEAEALPADRDEGALPA